MLLNLGVKAEFNHFRVNHDKFQLIRTLTVKKRRYDRIKPHGLSLACGTGNKQMRHFSKVGDEHIIADGGTKCNRKFIT